LSGAVRAVARALNWNHGSGKINLGNVVHGDVVLLCVASAALWDHVLGHSAASLLEDVPVGHLLDGCLSLLGDNSLDLVLGKWDGTALLYHSIGTLVDGRGVDGNVVASGSRLHGGAPALEAVPPGVHTLQAIWRHGSAYFLGDCDGVVLFNILFVSVSPFAPSIGVP